MGDIDKIEHNAVLSRVKIQVEFIDNIEIAIPYFLRKRYYISKEEKKESTLLIKVL